MQEMVWNAVKFIFIAKMREKSRRRQTGSSGVLSPTFGQIVNRARWVRKTGRRHISTSGLASGALGTLFLPYSGLYCRGIAKGQPLRESASFEPSNVKIRRRVWPLDEFPNKTKCKVQNVEITHVTLTTPLSGQSVTARLILHTANP